MITKTTRGICFTLTGIAIILFIYLFSTLSKEEKDEIEYGAYDLNESVYTESFVMEIGGFYKFKLAYNGIIIKECEAKVRTESITFISESKEEINEYKHFNINTISLYNANKTACMIMENETDEKGNLKFTLIGTVTDDIAGNYDLIYKDSGITSNVNWTITGETSETNRTQNETTLEDRNTYMCLAQDNNRNSYIRIFEDKTWKTYTFAILGRTIYLTETIL